MSALVYSYDKNRTEARNKPHQHKLRQLLQRTFEIGTHNNDGRDDV